jgi:hypothetical protein
MPTAAVAATAADTATLNICLRVNNASLLPLIEGDTAGSVFISISAAVCGGVVCGMSSGAVRDAARGISLNDISSRVIVMATHPLIESAQQLLCFVVVWLVAPCRLLHEYPHARYG